MPYHGDTPDHWFHPTLVVVKSDEQVRADIRAFARAYTGAFRWRWWWLPKPAQNCRTFQQQDMFDAVGLFEEPKYLYTQGPGCPFMFQVRRIRWRAADLATATPRRDVAGREAPRPAVERGRSPRRWPVC